MGDRIYIKQHESVPHISTVVISHPEKRNALTPKILTGLSDLLNDRQLREGTRVLVIRGEGEIAFSAGYDISQIKATGKGGGTEASASTLIRALQDIKGFPSPIISMIKGFCVGAGCHLAATTDIRIAADDVKIGMTPAKLGIIYHPDGISDFFSLIGPTNTKELFYTGKLYSANEAAKMGLLNRVVPETRLEETVYSIAEKIAYNAPLAVKGIKHIVNRWVDAVALSPEVYTEIGELIDIAYASEDIREGRRAFAEKRKPVFRGK